MLLKLRSKILNQTLSIFDQLNSTRANNSPPTRFNRELGNGEKMN